MPKPITFDIPLSAPFGKCKSCGGEIRWIMTMNKKQMPVNYDGTSHFATCPDADNWRKRN